ncbi:MAG: hypothetical protein JST28_18250 [Acidobacteria bacterium]|nr:hypothetical protein [Acidobacteriota bacterium]
MVAEVPPGPESPSAAKLAQTLEDYLASHPSAAMLEDGRVLFDMRLSHYSITESHGRCLLQLWSEERNVVRTVVELQQRAHSLRVVTRRMGAPKHQALELVPTSDRRTPTARDSARRSYQRLLERVLTRAFLGAKVDGFRTAMDLEHSFGPAYVRGRLLRGTACDAVIGISQAESSATIDGILTLGILWLDFCRQKADGRRHFGGLKVIVPAGAGRTTAERMAWLNHSAAEFQIYALDELTEELELIDFRDCGNQTARLVRAFSQEAAIERCKDAISKVMDLLPEDAESRVEIRPRSASEVGLLLHGLEFARIRHGASAHSFAQQDEITFGAGANETPLTAETEELCRELCSRLFASRHRDGTHNDPLFRMQPERWLESEFRSGIAELLPVLREETIYSQVPALSSGDRGMLDLLALDRNGRLCVIELKADEDLHLPMQALDYWIRVRALNADRQRTPMSGRLLSAFEREGYFPDTEVSELPPRLILAAPALRIHPANLPVLRYLSSEVDWELIALAEHWRNELKIVFRKRSSDLKA